MLRLQYCKLHVDVSSKNLPIINFKHSNSYYLFITIHLKYSV